MKVQLSTVALLSERYFCEYMKLCNHMIKRTEWCPPLNIIVFENAVIYAQFFFHGKVMFSSGDIHFSCFKPFLQL